MSIEIDSISKSFGATPVLRDVSLKVETGSLVALLGPSGSGKTTLLRVIAGLETADSGAVRFHGEDATSTHARARRVGFVFQHYALFRHMTVFENVAFGLRVRHRKLRPSREQVRAKVSDLLKLVQLESTAQRYPAQLSGGQRQRVALARALAVEPQVLLLDEPFGALDARVRQELRRWLRRLHDELNVTSVLVTHDQEEAMEVADQVAVLHDGRLEQTGTPEEVYDHPASPFIYDFFGNFSLFRGRVHQGRAWIAGLEVEVQEHHSVSDSPAVAYVRPHELEILRQRNGTPLTEAVVRHINAAGPTVRVELERQDTGDLVEAALTREQHDGLRLQAGEQVYIRPRNLRVFVEDYAI
ncbi:MAG TPA: sulfate/molybdate ABC transporter ATP-binding protein [Armatimonadota bacterium]